MIKYHMTDILNGNLSYLILGEIIVLEKTYTDIWLANKFQTGTMGKIGL